MSDKPMTVEEAAEFLGWKPRTVKERCRTDSTFPWSRPAKNYLFFKQDLVAWLRSGYSAKAQKAIQEGQCTEERTKAESVSGRGTSPLTEYENHLAQRIESARNAEKQKRTKRHGTASMV